MRVRECFNVLECVLRVGKTHVRADSSELYLENMNGLSTEIGKIGSEKWFKQMGKRNKALDNTKKSERATQADLMLLQDRKRIGSVLVSERAGKTQR